jgi:predicted signal transduction protein with EAL and GGDEF domain
LNSTVYLSAALGLAFMVWGLSLYPYGNIYSQSHVVFYMALTMIACVFCLMHLRAAAFVLALIVIDSVRRVLRPAGRGRARRHRRQHGAGHGRHAVHPLHPLQATLP